MKNRIEEFRRALQALYLEAPKIVVDDVMARFDDLLNNDKGVQSRDGGCLGLYLLLQEHYKETDKWVELNIIREFLGRIVTKIYEEIHALDDLKIPLHYRNIITAALEKRQEFADHFLKELQAKVKEEKK